MIWHFNRLRAFKSCSWLKSRGRVALNICVRNNDRSKAFWEALIMGFKMIYRKLNSIEIWPSYVINSFMIFEF